MVFNLLLACTGSVATIKLPLLLKKIKQRFQNISIRVVLTRSGEFFVKKDVEEMENIASIYRDSDEWNEWREIGDEILHIELTKWADAMLISPLGANTLAKLANGLCDNLLTCLCRAWNFEKPIFFAPAMNTFMWNHPITKQHTDTLIGWGYEMIAPISKTLACGDTGIGAMAEVDTLVEHLTKLLHDRPC